MTQYLLDDGSWENMGSFWTLDRLWPLLAPAGWVTVEFVT